MSYQPPQGPQGPPQEQSWQPPQQPPGWGQPGYQPPPSKPKPPLWRRPWFIIVSILVLVVIVGTLLGDPPAEEPSTGGQTEERQAQEAETAPADESAPGIGDSVRDGDFEFIVTAFRCSGGQCRAQMRVENIGSDPGTMFASNQYLYDDKGRKFEADDDSDDPLFLRELNPGAKVSGKIVWRVGQGVKANKLELHDSAFSGARRYSCEPSRTTSRACV